MTDSHTLKTGCIHWTSLFVCSLANNELCGIGFKSCNYVSTGAKIGTALGFVVGFVTLVACGILCWKRRQAFARGAQRLRKLTVLLRFDLQMKLSIMFVDNVEQQVDDVNDRIFYVKGNVDLDVCFAMQLAMHRMQKHVQLS